MDTTANKCKISKLTFQNKSNKVLVLNAILVSHINNELNNFFSIRKNNLNTNSHRHQGLHLLAHQLKMTPLRCWRSHWGVCKWTLSHHLRTCPGDRWPSCHWWWSVLSGSAALQGDTNTSTWSKESTFPHWCPISSHSCTEHSQVFLKPGNKAGEKNIYISICGGKQLNEPNTNPS